MQVLDFTTEQKPQKDSNEGKCEAFLGEKNSVGGSALGEPEHPDADMTADKKDAEAEKVSLSETLRVVKRILRDMLPIWHWMLLAVILSLTTSLLSMLSPELLGSLTDRIYSTITDGVPLGMSSFITHALLLGGIYAVTGILSALTTKVMNYSVSRHFTCRIRTDMSAKISRIPIRTFDNTPNGEIISRMTNDVSVMGGSVHDIFGVIVGGVIRLGVIATVIFISDPILAMTVIVFVPVSILLSARLASRSEKYYNLSREANGRLYSLAEENLTGFDTVKAFGLEAHQNERYGVLSADYAKKAEEAYRLSGTVQPLVAFINNVAYIAICLIGGYLAVIGEASVGELVSFIMYTKLFSGPLESIAQGLSMIQSTVASARRVYDFLDSEEMTEKSTDVLKIPTRGRVTFEDVSFSYTDEKPLIEHFSLDVSPGQKIAIVGPTGGGKTTIVNLLMRFYEPREGRILVDGVDIGEVSRDEVRELFGMVLQDTVLFSVSIFDNIAYGKRNATPEEVIAAARAAHVDSFIDALPDGYSTIVNEDSTNLSGGQKQLLTIARAYLSDRPILILDEATSNVDTRTEMIIQRTMDELMHTRTAFVIAHRLSTVENADLILVIDGGRIVERGTHRSLLEEGGLYRRIYESQYRTGG